MPHSTHESTRSARALPSPMKAVLLDMDGTLFDSERIFYDIFKEAEELFGFENCEGLLRQLTGARVVDPTPLFVDFLGSEALAQQVMAYRKEQVAARYPHVKAPLKPGAAELLAELKSRGIATALVTSSPMERVEKQFHDQGLPLNFDVIVTGGEVKEGKPAPDIYFLAASRLQISIASCVVVEDSRFGVAAGHASGAYTILVPDILKPSQETLETADFVCETLFDVRARLFP